ncbi:DUF2971 domain-containing protein [Dyadobacter sp. CY326]|uniref:DUF2971 domain-containing protein n=1 Tax=Dyadobacter sp. CY326 TaxID=2907300 RepID=UPI001F2D6F1E|nr:DUF2971 domain-containing protein [Dyadobacter sp. CY326]MCE7067406.1 DUF2971 domain-containing protein [Dyadobacter sp. CY326]
MTESQYRNVLHPLLTHPQLQGIFNDFPSYVMEENFPILTKAERQRIQKFVTSPDLKILLNALADPDALPKLITKQPDLSSNLKNNLNTRFGILSLTTRNDNLTMWSHYTLDHKGFVIELSPESQIFQNTKAKIKLLRTVQKVSYKRHRPNATLLDALDSNNGDGFTNLLKKTFLTKSLDWKYEQEMRMMSALTDEDVREIYPGIFIRDLRPSSILNIFFGVNSDSVLKSRVMSIIAHPNLSHVGVFQSLLHEEEYKVIFERI